MLEHLSEPGVTERLALVRLGTPRQSVTSMSTVPTVLFSTAA
jgi:hypothetical protein